jgi:hypothetical protein
MMARHRHIERFPAKWVPVRVKKTRQNKNLEPRSDSIGTDKVLAENVEPVWNFAGPERLIMNASFGMREKSC